MERQVPPLYKTWLALNHHKGATVRACPVDGNIAVNGTTISTEEIHKGGLAFLARNPPYSHFA